MIDFRVEPQFQERLDWMQTFVGEECETMDLLFPDMGTPFDTTHEASRQHLRPLQTQVKAQGMRRMVSWRDETRGIGADQ